MISPRELKEQYATGVNVSAFLKNQYGLDYNSEEIIEVSYDLQAGSYIEAMRNDNTLLHKQEYAGQIIQEIRSLCDSPVSLLEAGVGEATTLAEVIKGFAGNTTLAYGFDLSWSRTALARSWINKQGLDATLCTGSLMHIPFADASIDIVYTSHSIEPNKGSEEKILKELYRVTRKFLILLEPCYEFASEQARKRMDALGYCRGLGEISRRNGFKIIKQELFPFTINPLNPTGITIIEKPVEGDAPGSVLVCPRWKTSLQEIGGMLFSPEALVVYPVLGGIPCLRIENGIVASRFPEIILNPL